jgi:hypothetical protein
MTEVMISHVPNEHFAPMVIVTSKEGTIVFPVREMIETFEDKILSSFKYRSDTMSASHRQIVR